MRQLSQAGQQAVNKLAQQYHFSPEAVAAMLDAIIQGNGSMAQFSHPELGGSGQWMKGGMTMVGDMFNNDLKNRVERLGSDLSSLIANEPDLTHAGSFQSQRQGNQNQDAKVSHQHQDSSAPAGSVSLFVPELSAGSANWWPSDLRHPTSTGAQNNVRYAYFASAHRLAIDLSGKVTVYDTLDHQIGGFSQQQSSGGSLTFTSQHGLVDLASLPVVAGEGAKKGQAAETPAAPDSASRSEATTSGGDVFATIERLAGLRAKGIISDDEFSAKKSELLSRV